MHTKVAIIGSGPAAHTAAIYLSRAELKPLLYEGMMANGIAAGGQLTTTTEVENFPGFPEAISGYELTQRFRDQSVRFGTKIISETVSKLDLLSRPFKIWREGNEDQEPDTADSIVYATGAIAKRMSLKGEEKFWQNGISACAVCDGAIPMFRKKELAVIGGGDSAAEEAIFLTKFGTKVYVLVRRDQMRASNIMQNRLLNHPKIEVLWNTVATECYGDNVLQGIKIQSTETDEISNLPVKGLFYAIGHQPATQLIKGVIDTDSDGYIETVRGTTMTNIEGFFAAGDVQDKRYRQAITSAGTGCMAALECETFLEDHDVPVACEEIKNNVSDYIENPLLKISDAK